MAFVKDVGHAIAHVYFSEKYQTLQCFCHLSLTTMTARHQFKENCKKSNKNLVISDPTCGNLAFKYPNIQEPVS